MTDSAINRINELKKQAQDILVSEEKGLTVVEPQDMAKPENDTKFAHESAKILKDIIRQNGWARRIGGQSEHIQYEGWQTLGKYYSYTVKTFEAEPVEIAGIAGFKAKAMVVNEITGVEVGGAEAFCFRDEPNWKIKPMFQLASMAQTRAGSKALRQILGFVVALAGYSPTPAEEMTGDEYLGHGVVVPKKTVKAVIGDSQQVNKPAPAASDSVLISDAQKALLEKLLHEKGKTQQALEDTVWEYFSKTPNELTRKEASEVINKLMALPSVKKKPAPRVVTPKEQSQDLDFDAIDKAIAA